MSWHSGGHTNALVPLYAKGAGSEALAARADGWDEVRGAYLDNTEIGETVFDLLGHAPVSAQDVVGVEATVPLAQPAGELSLTVPALDQRVRFTGSATAQTAALPAVTVTDSRNEVQAQGDGWTVAGSASAFVAGNRSFGAEALAWVPNVVSSTSGANAGATATLEAPATLADADRGNRSGETVLSALLQLSVPADASSGRYGSEITLTLFPKD